MQFCKGMSHSQIQHDHIIVNSRCTIQLVQSTLVAREAKIALLAQAYHIGKTGTNHGISHNLMTRSKVNFLPEVAQHSSTTQSTQA